MITKRIILPLIWSLLFLANFPAMGQDKKESVNRIFIFDASGSMAYTWESGSKN